MDSTVAKIDLEFPFQDHESLIGILVIVPDEIALQLDQLELIVIHFGDNLRLPLFANQRELLLKIDCFEDHGIASLTVLQDVAEYPWLGAAGTDSAIRSNDETVLGGYQYSIRLER
jgi:hypothetical protein